MFLIKGILIRYLESIMLDADTEEQAIVLYNRKFERGEVSFTDEDLEYELMQIGNENEKESKEWVLKYIYVMEIVGIFIMK